MYSSYHSTSGTLFNTSGLFIQPHSARVGNKLLSELVMTKSVTDTVDARFSDSDDSDSLLTA